MLNEGHQNAVLNITKTLAMYLPTSSHDPAGITLRKDHPSNPYYFSPTRNQNHTHNS